MLNTIESVLVECNHYQYNIGERFLSLPWVHGSQAYICSYWVVLPACDSRPYLWNPGHVGGSGV
jgi:hypothetical protein